MKAFICLALISAVAAYPQWGGWGYPGAGYGWAGAGVGGWGPPPAPAPQPAPAPAAALGGSQGSVAAAQQSSQGHLQANQAQGSQASNLATANNQYGAAAQSQYSGLGS